MKKTGETVPKESKQTKDFHVHERALNSCERDGELPHPTKREHPEDLRNEEGTSNTKNLDRSPFYFLLLLSRTSSILNVQYRIVFSEWSRILSSKTLLSSVRWIRTIHKTYGNRKSKHKTSDNQRSKKAPPPQKKKEKKGEREGGGETRKGKKEEKRGENIAQEGFEGRHLEPRNKPSHKKSSTDSKDIAARHTTHTRHERQEKKKRKKTTALECVPSSKLCNHCTRCELCIGSSGLYGWGIARRSIRSSAFVYERWGCIEGVSFLFPRILLELISPTHLSEPMSSG